jgi:Ca2+-dependent lipid-binding protein
MAGHLSVTVVEARSLKDEDTFGGSNDAYVEVYIDDDYKQRTATISNSKTPEWNETFQL